MSVTLGFDYGLQRVGVAIGNHLTGTARALQALSCPRDEQGWRKISRLIEQWQPQQIVVGSPADNAAGTPVSKAIRGFVAELQTRYTLPVSLVDESYSSRSAASELRDARAGGKKSRRVRPGDEDSLAAADLLRQWMSDGH